MTRYLPARSYMHLGWAGLLLGVGCAAMASRWPLAAIPTGLFLASAALNFFLATRPAIVLTKDTLSVGGVTLRWLDIVRIDRTGWVSPLVVWLALRDGSQKLLIYPGALKGSRRLSAELDRRLAASVAALSPASKPPDDSGERLPLLNPDDEAEVERLFQRLKSVGHLEQEDR
jgi:hypothetical protein